MCVCVCVCVLITCGCIHAQEQTVPPFCVLIFFSCVIIFCVLIFFFCVIIGCIHAQAQTDREREREKERESLCVTTVSTYTLSQRERERDSVCMCDPPATHTISHTLYGSQYHTHYKISLLPTLYLSQFCVLIFFFVLSFFVT